MIYGAFITVYLPATWNLYLLIENYWPKTPRNFAQHSSLGRWCSDIRIAVTPSQFNVPKHTFSISTLPKFLIFPASCRFGSWVDLNRTRHQNGSRPRGTPCPWFLFTSHSYLPSALSLSVPTRILPFFFFCNSPDSASTLPNFSTLSFSRSCALYPTHASRRRALCHFQYVSLHHSPFLSYVPSNTLSTCIPNPFSN